jgi:hypothetical protein
VDEWDDEDEFERVDEVIADLRRGDVEAEEEGKSETEDGSAAEDGIDADEQADGDAPGKLFGGCSHAEERKNGKGKAAIDPAVMNGNGASDRDAARDDAI